MRQCERSAPDPEFPGRYILDEARFPGGKEHIFNREENEFEPTEHIAR